MMRSRLTLNVANVYASPGRAGTHAVARSGHRRLAYAPGRARALARRASASRSAINTLLSSTRIQPRVTKSCSALLIDARSAPTSAPSPPG